MIPGPPTQTSVRRAVEEAKRSSASFAANASGCSRSVFNGASEAVVDISVAAGFLDEGRRRMEALEFRAKSQDSAAEAFEAFRRGVLMAARLPSGDGTALLDHYPQKEEILDFLVDFYERRRLHQARVSETVNMWNWARGLAEERGIQIHRRRLSSSMGTSAVTAEGPDRHEVAAVGAADDTDALYRGHCDQCKRELLVGAGWYHRLGSSDDLCTAHWQELRDADRAAFTQISTVGNLGFDRDMYKEMGDETAATVKEPSKQLFAPPDRAAVGPRLEVGQAMEYDSVSAGRWLPCKVVNVDPRSGSVEIDLKPGYFMPFSEQSRRLRPPAVASSVSAIGASGGTLVVWASLDPRKGTIDFYPAKLCAALETAWARGETELDISSFIKGAMVRLQPKIQQRTERGSRDVRRVELMATEEQSVVLQVVQRKDWRLADPGEPAEERRALVPPSSAVAASASGGA